MVQTHCNSHIVPFEAMRASVAAFGIQGDIMLQLCFYNYWFWGGGRCENSEICILNKCCDLYYNGQTGCIRHMFIYYQTGVGGGERGDMNCCSFQDCALKISSQVGLLKSIFGTRFPPPYATLFFFNLSHSYKVCSQRHTVQTLLVLTIHPPN